MIGYSKLTLNPQKVDIAIYDAKGNKVKFSRKDKVRKDANRILLSEERIGFESGIQLEFEKGECDNYDIVCEIDGVKETYPIDIKLTEIERRENDRRYVNTFDMLKHFDKERLTDSIYLIKTKGMSEFKSIFKERLSKDDYEKYFETHRANKVELGRQRNHQFSCLPKISVVVPTWNTPIKYLIDMIESVSNQTYSNWELCIADGSEGNKKLEKVLRKYHAKDNRIVYHINEKNLGIAGNTNEALKIATGDYIALLDHDDELAPNALYEVVRVINENDDADVVYTDEDKISDVSAQHFGPAFKPDFNLDLLRSNNYICHFFVVKKDIVDDIKGFRSEFDGSQDFDFIFRCIEKARNVYHIPQILYYWRCHPNSVAGNPESKLYAYEAGKKAIEEHLQRTGECDAEVEMLPYWGLYRVIYPVKSEDKVSVIIPNKDHKDDLKTCVTSILQKTTYGNYELIIVENNSETNEIFDYYKELEMNSRIKVVTWNGEFNYSAINNFGVSNSDGDYIVFLNNDTEIISENWIETMLGNCQRKEVGAVGAKLYYKDDTIQHAGVVLNLGGIAGHVMVGESRESLGYCAKAKVQLNYSAVTAACMIMSRENFDKVGGFDEKLGVAFNDVDLCLKVRELDKLIVFDPNVELYHYESKSRGYETTPEKDMRFKKEGDYMKNKWSDVLSREDPYYNCNFTLKKSDFSLRV